LEREQTRILSRLAPLSRLWFSLFLKLRSNVSQSLTADDLVIWRAICWYGEGVRGCSREKLQATHGSGSTMSHIHVLSTTRRFAPFHSHPPPIAP
jgi:hypothetical protein